MRIVILGAPGAGKKTQSALLAEKLDLSIVKTGELLKKAIEEQSPLGLEAKALQDAGRVVTEDIVLGLVREHLLDPTVKRGFILDGFPRNLLQALTLDELLVEIEQPLDLVVLLDIDSDNLIERLAGRRTCHSCGQRYNIYWSPPLVDDICDTCGGRLHQRSDDNEETVSDRIHVFDHLIAPLITHYRKSDRLIRVDGNGEIETVFASLMEAIEASSKSKSTTAVSPAMADIESDFSAEEERPANGSEAESDLAATKQESVEQTNSPADGKPKVLSEATKDDPEKSNSAAKITTKKLKTKAKPAKTTTEPTAKKGKKKLAKTTKKSAKATAKKAAVKSKSTSKTKPAIISKDSAKKSKTVKKSVTKKGKATADQKKTGQQLTKTAVTKKKRASKSEPKKVAAKKRVLKTNKKAISKKRVSSPKKKLAKKGKATQVRKPTAKKVIKKSLPKQKVVKRGKATQVRKPTAKKVTKKSLPKQKLAKKGKATQVRKPTAKKVIKKSLPKQKVAKKGKATQVRKTTAKKVTKKSLPKQKVVKKKIAKKSTVKKKSVKKQPLKNRLKKR